MKQLFLLPFLLFPFCLFGQGLFTKITDANNPAVTFTNTAAGYKGAVWIDLDHDNWPDLFASQRFLFRNNRDGNFTQLTDVNGAGGGQDAAGASSGDLDNDGHLDCITASLVSGLHRNNGDNTFTTLSANLSNFASYSAWDCALTDADNNGRLDLLYVHANGFHTTGPFSCRFYLQNTDGTFTQKTGNEFTDDLGAYTVPVWSDFDLDGDVDLFIGAGPVNTPPGALPDFCYKNMLKETGSFSLQRLTTSPFMLPQDGQVYNFIDFDNDGDLDFCLTNYALAPTRFYRKDANGYTGLNTPFTNTNSHLSNCWGDVDNDGFLDVLIAVDGDAKVHYFRNKGDGTFQADQVAGTAGSKICGIAMADYDNDGDLDFYTNGPTTARSLFRNNAESNNRHWAQFTLEGVQSNRSAIGALLRLKVNIGGWQIREVSAHNSFQSQSDLRQHFGLNDAAEIDSLIVRWPSGTTQVFTNLSTNNFYKIIENQGINVITPTIEPTAGATLEISPNPLSLEFGVKSSEKITAVEMFDSTGKIVPLTKTASGEEWRLRMTGSPQAGAYFLRVRFESGAAAVRQVMKF